jgi:hypothetical protein
MGLAQRLEMLGDVGDGHCGLGGESLDVPWSLGQEVDQLEAPIAGEGLRDARELGIEAVFKWTVTHGLSRHCSPME